MLTQIQKVLAVKKGSNQQLQKLINCIFFCIARTSRLSWKNHFLLDSLDHLHRLGWHQLGKAILLLPEEALPDPLVHLTLHGSQLILLLGDSKLATGLCLLKRARNLFVFQLVLPELLHQLLICHVQQVLLLVVVDSSLSKWHYTVTQKLVTTLPGIKLKSSGQLAQMNGIGLSFKFGCILATFP